MTELDVPQLLAGGEAFADLSYWRKVTVSGRDAGGWLQDLISADIDDRVPGRAWRSLLLSPTGRIRAEFTVVAIARGWLLLQDPSQPRPIDQLLAPYVLSSDVTLDDRTQDFALFAFPGRRVYLDTPTEMASSPSCLGAGGLDLVAPMADRDRLTVELEALFVLAGNEAVEEWRVLAGIPRFGVDATEDDLPQEAALDDAVAFDKGCYLGQEAVAKVRNLGHPRRLVLHLRAEGAVSPGDPVRADGEDVGLVTSAVSWGDGAVVFARVGWGARERSLETATGVQLVAVQVRRPV